MSDQTEPIGLDEAYDLETPDDNRSLYARWAATYERDFIGPMGYVYHQNVAALHVRAGVTGPVLDVGCGTGLVGTVLADLGVDEIDGIDISPEMLERAREKSVYRSLLVADVTQRLDVDDNSYAGIVSVGTFTHGHLGPEPIIELVRIADSGATLTLGINGEHWSEMGFGPLIDGLVADRLITTPTFETVRIYTDAAGEHADDLARVVQFTAC